MEIIPAIDIINGQCVRLTQGDYTRQTVYNTNPVEVAQQFEAAGICRLHMVDLDGAKAGAVQNMAVLEAVAKATNLQIDFSGGIKTTETVQTVLNAGAAMVAVGSIAVRDKDLLAGWVAQWGSQTFLVGADVLDEQVKISGWLEATGVNIYQFLQDMQSIGITQVFCTDIAKDGAMQGPSIDLYKNILQRFPALQLIASGGVSNLADAKVLKAIGCNGAIIGKAIYEGTVSITDLLQLNHTNDVV